MSANLSSLRQERDFVRWVWAEGVSMVGSATTTIVLPVLVFEATRSAAQTGVLFALRVVPYLLFGLIAGPIADRVRRRLLIIGGNVAEGLLVMTIPIAHAFGVLTIAQIYVVALLSATAFVFSDAAVFGAVPAMVGPERLPAANGLLSTIASGAEILGPVVAGLLIAGVGATTVVWIDAASFLFAAAVQTTIRSGLGAATRDPDVDQQGLRETRSRAIAFIRNEPTIRILLLLGFANSTGFGMVLGLLVPYAVQELGLAVDDARIGLLYGAVGVGSLLVGLTFARFYRADRIPVLAPLTIGTAGALAASLVLPGRWQVAIVLVLLFSSAVSLFIMTGITYRQVASPDGLRSTVNVIGRMVAWGGQPFGAAAGALIAATLSITVAYTTASMIMIVAAAVAAIAFGRRVDAASG